MHMQRLTTISFSQLQSYVSFRKFCMDVQHLPTDLYVLFSDVLQGARNTNDIFPYFLAHARKVFPHLECIDDLRCEWKRQKQVLMQMRKIELMAIMEVTLV